MQLLVSSLALALRSAAFTPDGDTVVDRARHQIDSINAEYIVFDTPK